MKAKLGFYQRYIKVPQDMIIAAVNEAMRTADTDAAKSMSQMTGGLNLGGLF